MKHPIRDNQRLHAEAYETVCARVCAFYGVENAELYFQFARKQIISQCEPDEFGWEQYTSLRDWHEQIVLASRFKQDKFLAGFFIDNHDGTVSDTRTGLSWMRCAVGQTWNGVTCVGNPDKFKWDAAGALRVNFAGRSDWRLPSIEELKSIVATEKKAPAIDSVVFPNTPSWGFWSDSASADSMKSAWSVRFTSGYAICDHKSFGNCVRLVRSVQLSPANEERKDSSLRFKLPFAIQPTNAVIDANSGIFDTIEKTGENSLPVPPKFDLAKDVFGEAASHQIADDHFIDNGNGTVTDTRTGLTWMRFALGQTWNGVTCVGDATKVSWDSANRLQQDFAGFTDWRLPSIEELKTLVVTGRGKPATYGLIFHQTPPSVFWSSTAYTEYPAFAWGINFQYGDVGDHHRVYANCHVRLVRSVSLSQRDDEAKDRVSATAAALSRPINAVTGIKSGMSEEIESKSDSLVSIVSEQNSLDRTDEIIERLESLESTFLSALGRMERLLESLAINQAAVRAVADPIAKNPALNAANSNELHRKLINAAQVEMLKRAVAIESRQRVSPVIYTSLPQVLHGLIELEEVSLAELRRHLLPLDLLPSAVIEEVNEIAFDLVGEVALEEDGERVIVYREVLVRVLETWSPPYSRS